MKQTNEAKYYGVQACRSIFQKRPKSIIRLYVLKENLKSWGHEMNYCSQHKLAYHLVSREDLEKIAESSHHEGVVVVAKKQSMANANQLINPRATQDLIVWLDKVGNPHNLGNISRTMAHYGATKVLSSDREFRGLPPSACRVAEGANELVQFAQTTTPKDTVTELKAAGYQIIGTHCTKGHSLFKFKFPQKCVLLIGAETEGISKVTEKLCDNLITIPQALPIQSLNVASASAIFIHEWSKQILHSV